MYYSMKTKAYSLSTLSQKSATICRRKVRLLNFCATVAEFRRFVSPFPATVSFSATVWTGLYMHRSIDYNARIL